MKIKILLLATLSVLLFGACEDWLDAGSSTQIKGKDLLETETGYQDALTGIYLNMASTDLYGKNLSWYFVDLLAQPYVYEPLTQEHYYLMSAEYDNTRVEPFVNTLWNQSYNTIANINNLLRHVQTDGESVLHPESRKLFEGELLGLRAYLHFDLLRLYGYGNLAQRVDFEEKRTIPYVREYSKELTPQLTYSKTIDLMIEDLKAAAACLKDVDPLVGHSLSAEANFNGFWNNRKLHLNYYAVQAELARVYMWEGSAESLQAAYDIATELVALEGTAYAWVNPSNLTGITEIDRVFSTEHLFTLNVFNFRDIVNNGLTDPRYNASAPTSVIQWSRVAYDIFNAYSYDYGTEQYLPGYVGFDDYRFALHYMETEKNGVSCYMAYKLAHPTGDLSKNNYVNKLPMIKISEMYYIIAEYYLSKGNEDGALEIINLVRSKRGLANPLTRELIEDEWSQTVADELTKEYLREFISEGQLFYYYKRLGLENPLYIYGSENFEFNDERYLLPYPTAEIENGYRVQE